MASRRRYEGSRGHSTRTHTTVRRTPISGEMGGTQTETIRTYERRQRRRPPGPSRIARGITRQPTGGLLAAELLVGFAIVLIRALGDYQLTDEGTQRGTLNTPANGGYGPFTVLAGLIASFFGLSFLAAGGGKRAKAANAFGALIIIVLMLKSMDEIEIVGKFITTNPATRTVETAAYTSADTQPWGTAWQVSSSAASNTTLTAYTGLSGATAGLASYGAAFALSSSPAASTAAGAPPASSTS